ncbi:MAG: helix-turn-helix domain-containing protein [Muribaculaceae bacterium]
MSPVSRFFNNSHGKTFFEFVNEYRVQHARTLLQSGNDKLDIVAEKSGFSSRQSFHRVFTKLTGSSPGQYRSGQQAGPGGTGIQ